MLPHSSASMRLAPAAPIVCSSYRKRILNICVFGVQRQRWQKKKKKSSIEYSKWLTLNSAK